MSDSQLRTIVAVIALNFQLLMLVLWLLLSFGSSPDSERTQTLRSVLAMLVIPASVVVNLLAIHLRSK
jgi:hypothetical protein